MRITGPSQWTLAELLKRREALLTYDQSDLSIRSQLRRVEAELARRGIDLS